MVLSLDAPVMAERCRTSLAGIRKKAAVLDRHVPSHQPRESPVLVAPGEPALVACADLHRLSNIRGLLASLLAEEVALANHDSISAHHVEGMGCACLAVLEHDRVERAPQRELGRASCRESEQEHSGDE